MMDTSQTNSKDPEIIPLAKTDWIRFGALKIQAKSKRMWQVNRVPNAALKDIITHQII